MFCLEPQGPLQSRKFLLHKKATLASSSGSLVCDETYHFGTWDKIDPAMHTQNSTFLGSGSREKEYIIFGDMEENVCVIITLLPGIATISSQLRMAAAAWS